MTHSVWDVLTISKISSKSLECKKEKIKAWKWRSGLKRVILGVSQHMNMIYKKGMEISLKEIKVIEKIGFVSIRKGKSSKQQKCYSEEMWRLLSCFNYHEGILGYYQINTLEKYLFVVGSILNSAGQVYAQDGLAYQAIWNSKELSTEDWASEMQCASWLTSCEVNLPWFLLGSLIFSSLCVQLVSLELRKSIPVVLANKVEATLPPGPSLGKSGCCSYVIFTASKHDCIVCGTRDILSHRQLEKNIFISCVQYCWETKTKN